MVLTGPPLPVGAPTDASRLEEVTLWFLVGLQSVPTFCNSHQEHLKKDDLLQVLQSVRHTQGHHRKVTARERVRLGTGLCLFWGQGWGPRVSQVRSSCVNLKHESGNASRGREKQGHLGAGYLGAPGLFGGDRRGLAWRCLAVWLAVCLSDMDSFGTGASMVRSLVTGLNHSKNPALSGT